MYTVKSRGAATLSHGHTGHHGAAAHPPALEPDHPHPPVAAGMPHPWHFAAEYLLLPLGATVALIWVNTDPIGYFRVTGKLDFLARNIAMVPFFGLLMKEVVEATAPGGFLHPWRRAALPFVASIGLTLVPLLAFAALVPQFDEPRVLEGWPAVFATDLALGYFVARWIFGRHPAVPFFVLLAIGANGLGLLALAVTGTATTWHLTVAVPLMAAAITIAGMLRNLKVRSVWPYVFAAGGFSWCALYFGGLEPAFALVPILPFVPHATRDPGFFVDARPNARDPLSHFELWSRHPAQIGLLLFGLVAAGVPLQALDLGTLALPLTAVIAKPIALFLGVGIALALGLHLPHRIGWRELVVLGFIAAIGFTVALFFATATVGPGPTLSELKMGALLTVAGSLLAIAAAAVLRIGRFGH